MAKQLQLRRGTTSQHSTFTGANGEVTIDTDKKVVVVHDGTTVGGIPLARHDTKVDKITSTDRAIALFNGTTGSLQNSTLTVDTAGNIGSGTQSFNGFGGSGFKNYIINGDMSVNQYGTFAVAVTAAGQFPLDRMQMVASQSNKITAQQRTSGAVAMGNAPFENCLQVLTVSGYSPTATEQFRISHKIEGLNTANFRFGKSNAKKITLSFWVKSSVVGLYAVSFRNSSGDRSYVATYTINTANTFEYKTITINGDTIGTWLYDTGIGLRIDFNLASGSTYTTSMPNQWVSGSYTSATGVVNSIATTGNEFIITGVQLEEGSIATPFEQRPYGLELSLCQRYYETGYFAVTAGTIGNGTVLTTNIVYKNTKRISSTVSYTGVTYTNCSNIATNLNTISLVAPQLNVSVGGYAYATGIYIAASEL